VRELAELVQAVVGFVERLVFDPTKLDGHLRELLDMPRIKATGWQPRIPPREGLEALYGAYKTTHALLHNQPIDAARVAG
jgi:nucleoside-diphosphate-sugar epimerase